MTTIKMYENALLGISIALLLFMVVLLVLSVMLFSRFRLLKHQVERLLNADKNTIPMDVLARTDGSIPKNQYVHNKNTHLSVKRQNSQESVVNVPSPDPKRRSMLNSQGSNDSSHSLNRTSGYSHQSGDSNPTFSEWTEEQSAGSSRHSTGCQESLEASHNARMETMAIGMIDISYEERQEIVRRSRLSKNFDREFKDIQKEVPISYNNPGFQMSPGPSEPGDWGRASVSDDQSIAQAQQGTCFRYGEENAGMVGEEATDENIYDLPPDEPDEEAVNEPIYMNYGQMRQQVELDMGEDFPA
ncbi:uncharacterized protein LOC116618485 isoform X2 [Nematostella vectensis]|nr:uncharacterized protein LOC116618485 isoform X2 [Nematostella vectensis]XP_032238110.2 uncharacterized protein LOC116618485 isoform X2 [Nematostella vectensis]